MRTNLPCCDFKNCKYEFDGNCLDLNQYKKCEYAYLVNKDVPKYVDYDKEGCCSSAYCPNCGYEFVYYEEPWECTYCPDCGQALEWVVHRTRIIISGSRDFKYKDYLYKKLDKIIKENKYINVEIVTGEAIGADKFAEEYAKDREYVLSVFNADWNYYGKIAGYKRNDAMIEYADKAERKVLVAFPIGESKGTRDIIDKAKKKEFDVFVYET